jgi:hypothetical protein
LATFVIALALSGFGLAATQSNSILEHLKFARSVYEIPMDLQGCGEQSILAAVDCEIL